MSRPRENHSQSVPLPFFLEEAKKEPASTLLTCVPGLLEPGQTRAGVVPGGDFQARPSR